jgi:hypothetical protein
VSGAHAVRERLATLPQFVTPPPSGEPTAPPRIRVLLNAEASRRAIMDGFTRLCVEAGGGPAVFYFAGHGSMQGPGDRPTLISVDGRTEGVFDITLDELAQIARGSACRLVSLLDAGFRPGPRGLAPTRFRFTPRDLRPIPATREIRIGGGEQEQSSLLGMMPAIGEATGFFDAGSKGFLFTGSAARTLQASLPARPAAPDEPAWLARWFATDTSAEISAFLAELSRNRCPARCATSTLPSTCAGKPRCRASRRAITMAGSWSRPGRTRSARSAS